MKQFTRYFSLVIAFTLAFSFANAQNMMTKAQFLGLKTNSVNITPEKNVMSTRDMLLEEGFDVDFPPAGWTTIDFHASENWLQSNPDGNNFDQVDPLSLFSAVVPWVGEDQDEWMITPVIDSAGDTPLKV